MPTVTICGFNVEWMNDWFTADADPVAFRPTFTRDGHTSNTPQTATRTAAVIRAIDPDIMAISEGPSRPAELELFIHDYLSENGQPLYEFFLIGQRRSPLVNWLWDSPEHTNGAACAERTIAFANVSTHSLFTGYGAY